MMRNRIVAYHYRQASPWLLEWSKDGVLTASEPAEERPTHRAWLAPALMDVQVNGFAGVDFQSPGLSHDQLLRAVKGLRQSGCTRFLPTLVTRPWPEMLEILASLRTLREHGQELKESITGWHLEGPFLSSEPGYCGAHAPEHMVDPKPEHFEQLREAAGDNVLLVTLAPERPGSAAAIRHARTLGIHVSLGHTNATAAQLSEAVEAGATCFTHLGNACPQALDRHDNILWRALDIPELHVSLIADGIHVSPSCFRLLHRAKSGRRLLYTTDAMAAAGVGPGTYALGNLSLEVGADGIVRQPGRTNFAGSSLTPIRGVRRAAGMLGVHWGEAWDRFSLVPGAWLGHPVSLKAGHRADFCLITPPRDGGDLRRTRLSAYVAGHAVADAIEDLSDIQGLEMPASL